RVGAGCLRRRRPAQGRPVRAGSHRARPRPRPRRPCGSRTTLSWSRVIGCVLLVATPLVVGLARGQPATPRLLVVTYAAGFQHDVVRRPVAGTRGTAETVIAELGRRPPGFDVTFV